MDVLKFVEERNRMCSTYSDCENCPIANGTTCQAIKNITEQMIDTVEKWSAEHPRKTRQSIFLQQYPEVPLTYDGVINIKPCQMINHYTYEDGCDFDNHINCMKCKEKYWLKEIKERLKK